MMKKIILLLPVVGIVFGILLKIAELLLFTLNYYTAKFFNHNLYPLFDFFNINTSEGYPVLSSGYFNKLFLALPLLALISIVAAVVIRVKSPSSKSLNGFIIFNILFFLIPIILFLWGLTLIRV